MGSGKLFRELSESVWTQYVCNICGYKGKMCSGGPWPKWTYLKVEWVCDVWWSESRPGCVYLAPLIIWKRPSISRTLQHNRTSKSSEFDEGIMCFYNFYGVPDLPFGKDGALKVRFIPLTNHCGGAEASKRWHMRYILTAQGGQMTSLEIAIPRAKKEGAQHNAEWHRFASWPILNPSSKDRRAGKDKREPAKL